MNKKVIAYTLVTGFSLLSILGTSQSAEASYRSFLQNSISNPTTTNTVAPQPAQQTTQQPQSNFNDFWTLRRANFRSPLNPTTTQPTNTVPTQQPVVQQPVTQQPVQQQPTVLQPAQSPTSPIVNHSISAREMEMLNLINQERAKVGAQPLKIDQELSKWARIKSQDMKDNNYFAHQSPTYGSPFEMMRNAGIQYRSAAENIAASQSVTISHHRLMASEGHRRNILNPNFTHIGIGVVDQNGGSGVLVTQLFNAK